MKTVKHVIRATLIISLIVFSTACGSSGSTDPNEEVAGVFQAATFLANPKMYDSAIMLNKWVLNGDGVGTGAALFSDGRQVDPVPMVYEVGSDGTGTFNFDMPDARPLVGNASFAENTAGLSRIDENPDDFNQGIGIGFGVRPDTSVKSIAGEYHSYILYHVTGSSAFDVAIHDFVFAADGTGTVSISGQSAGFTYSIVDGLIVMDFLSGPTHDPISAYISTDGNYMIAYDAVHLDQNIGIQILIKAGSGLSTADVSGEYAISALHNLTAGRSIPWTLKGSADFDGKGAATITFNGRETPIAASYQIASNGEFNLAFADSPNDVTTGWVSPNREVLIVVDTEEAPVNDETISFSIMIKKW